MTTAPGVTAMFEVAANPDSDSTLPFLIRLPPPDGELVLKAPIVGYRFLGAALVHAQADGTSAATS